MPAKNESIAPVLMMLVVFLLVMYMVSCEQYPYPRHDSGELVALRASILTEGSFFLGCGSIDDEPVYHFIRKAPDGALRLTWAPASWCVIYEDVADGVPHYKQQRGYLTKDFAYWDV